MASNWKCFTSPYKMPFSSFNRRFFFSASLLRTYIYTIIHLQRKVLTEELNALQLGIKDLRLLIDRDVTLASLIGDEFYFLLLPCEFGFVRVEFLLQQVILVEQRLLSHGEVLDFLHALQQAGLRLLNFILVLRDEEFLGFLPHLDLALTRYVLFEGGLHITYKTIPWAPCWASWRPCISPCVGYLASPALPNSTRIFVANHSKLWYIEVNTHMTSVVGIDEVFGSIISFHQFREILLQSLFFLLNRGRHSNNNLTVFVNFEC